MTVVNKKKKAFDVDITREGKWGNPNYLKDEAGRAKVIEDYRAYLKTQPYLLNALPELVGKRMGCVCAPRACHGDVLDAYVNPQVGNTRVLIAGSRSALVTEWAIHELIREFLPDTPCTFVTGGAKGIDQYGHRYALQHYCDSLVIPALWEIHGRGAGHKRNRVMVELIDCAIIFWTGCKKTSPGTWDMIKLCEDNQIELKIILIEGK